MAWLQQAPGWPEGYWPGCYRPHVGLRVLAWLLQAAGWPWGTGLAGAAHMGPGCYRPHVGLRVLGVLARLLQAPGWPWVLAWLPQPTGGTGLAATALRIAWGYWPGRYRLQVCLAGTGLAAAAHRGYWLCCYCPQDSLGVIA